MHITNGSGTGSDGPAITNDLNPTVPKTVGDVLVEPAVIGVAVVVKKYVWIEDATLHIRAKFDAEENYVLKKKAKTTWNLKRRKHFVPKETHQTKMIICLRQHTARLSYA